MPEIRIELFGGFRVSVAGRPVPDTSWRRRKAAAVVKLLALEPGHRMHRERLMDTLWPDLDPAAAAANLRKAIHHARRAMGDPVLRSDTDLLSLSAEELWVDLDAFHAEASVARHTEDIAAYERAIEVYREGLLPEDVYEPWAQSPRDEAHLDFLSVLEELAALLETTGEVDRAVNVVRRLIAADPLREESYVSAMRLHALAGRRSEAMQEFERLRGLLKAELGTEPGPEAQQLFEEIRARQTVQPELTAELWERVGDLRTLSGDAPGAAKAYEAALAAGHGAERIGPIERKCAEAWLMQHRPDTAAHHLRAAETAPSDDAERGRLLRAWANHDWETGDLDAAQLHAERARDIADAHGTAEDRAAAHEALAIVSHYRGQWREGLQSELQRLIGDDVGSTQLARVFDIHHCIGQYHLYGDGLADSVESYARRLLDRAEEIGALRAQAFAWCLLGESLLLQARWDESSGCLERSCDLHASLGTRSGALAWQRRAELAISVGDFTAADEYLRRASAIATVSAMASHLWGRIHATRAFAAVEQDEPAEAVRSVRAAATAAARYGTCPTCSALLNPIAAEAFGRLQDRENARTYAESAARVASLFASSAWRAMSESSAGSMAAAEGDDPAAAEHFAAAAELYRKAGQPYWAERTLRLTAARV